MTDQEIVDGLINRDEKSPIGFQHKISSVVYQCN